jgi:hypothetical protein
LWATRDEVDGDRVLMEEPQTVEYVKMRPQPPARACFASRRNCRAAAAEAVRRERCNCNKTAGHGFRLPVQLPLRVVAEEEKLQDVLAMA